MIDLKMFCGDRFEAPLRLNDDAVATDGVAMVRVFGAGDNLPEVEINLRSRMRSYLSGERGKPVSLADLDLSGVRHCNICAGTGTTTRAPCTECEEGYFVHGSHEYECAHCDGIGNLEKAVGPSRCSKCRGLKWGLGPDIEIGPTLLDSGRLMRLRCALPNVVIYPAKDLLPVVFTFDGGDGVLMAMRRAEM